MKALGQSRVEPSSVPEKRDGVRVRVHCGIWSNEIYFWHNGRKLTFAKLPLAREEALRLGYAGIEVTPEKVTPRVAHPLRSK